MLYEHLYMIIFWTPVIQEHVRCLFLYLKKHQKGAISFHFNGVHRPTQYAQYSTDMLRQVPLCRPTGF